jgi:hypothetical protein
MEMEQQVYPLFSSFVRDLGKTYPEIKNCLYRNYEECLVDTDGKPLSECPKLQVFLDVVHTHNTKITKKDITFFETENILEEISFHNLWHKNISDKTRATIWRYFQTFSLLTINLKSSQALKDALSSIHNDEEVDLEDKVVAKELKKMKQLSESVQQEIPDDSGELDLEDMLGGLMDTNIGKIAQEVAGTMDMEQVFGKVDESTNPMELMSQMMNPDKMGQIFQNINSVMEKKMKDGEFQQEDLKKEAEGMYGNMAQNPMFKNMMSQMQPEGAGGPEQPEGPTLEPEPELTKEEKRRLLKEKIKEKEDERTGSTQ